MWSGTCIVLSRKTALSDFLLWIGFFWRVLCFSSVPIRRRKETDEPRHMLPCCKAWACVLQQQGEETSYPKWRALESCTIDMFLWLPALQTGNVWFRIAGQDTVFLVRALGWKIALAEWTPFLGYIFVCVERLEILSLICCASGVRFRRAGIYSQTLAQKIKISTNEVPLTTWGLSPFSFFESFIQSADVIASFKAIVKQFAGEIQRLCTRPYLLPYIQFKL